MLVAEGAAPSSPVDFYAAAGAVLAVAMLAKFVTHTE
ncbi:hypothetical protein M2275_006813 [Rhodococcus opacus]|nr:hypothetical protein [Rhodococcus opacus]